MIEPKHGTTIDEYCEYLKYIKDYFNYRVDVVFDIYFSSSLKQAVRENRGVGPSMIVKGVTKV